MELLVAVRNATSGEVVRGEFDLDLVAGQDADVVHPHLSGDVSQQLVAVVELDTEHGVGQALKNRALHQNCVFFGSDDAYLPSCGIVRWPAPVLARANKGQRAQTTSLFPAPFGTNLSAAAICVGSGFEGRTDPGEDCVFVAEAINRHQETPLIEPVEEWAGL